MEKNNMPDRADEVKSLILRTCSDEKIRDMIMRFLAKNAETGDVFKLIHDRIALEIELHDLEEKWGTRKN